MHKPDLLRPTLIAGIVFGLASSIPLVNVGNCCCCLWVFSTGWMATWMYASAGRRIGYGINLTDGMLVGFVAGLIGGFVSTIVETFVTLALGDRMREFALRMIDEQQVPPEMEGMVDVMRQSLEQDPTVGSLIASLIVSLVLFGILSTISGVVTAALMRGGNPGAGTIPGPPSPPAPGGWSGGGGTASSGPSGSSGQGSPGAGSRGSGWDDPPNPSAFGPGAS